MMRGNIQRLFVSIFFSLILWLPSAQAQIPSLSDLIGGDHGGINNLISTGDLKIVATNEKQELLQLRKKLSDLSTNRESWRKETNKHLSRLEQIRGLLSKKMPANQPDYLSYRTELTHLEKALKTAVDRLQYLSFALVEEIQLIDRGIQTSDIVLSRFSESDDAEERPKKSPISFDTVLAFSDQLNHALMELALARSNERSLVREVVSPSPVDEESVFRSDDEMVSIASVPPEKGLATLEKSQEIRRETLEVSDRVARLNALCSERRNHVAEVRVKVARLEILEKQQQSENLKRRYAEMNARVSVQVDDLAVQEEKKALLVRETSDEIEKLRIELFELRNEPVTLPQENEVLISKAQLHRIKIAALQEKLSHLELKNELALFKYNSLLAIYKIQGGSGPSKEFLESNEYVLDDDSQADRILELNRRREARIQQLNRMTQVEPSDPGEGLIQRDVIAAMEELIGTYGKQEVLLEKERQISSVVAFHIDRNVKQGRSVWWYILHGAGMVALLFLSGYLSIMLSNGMLRIAAIIRKKETSEDAPISLGGRGLIDLAQSSVRTLVFLLFVTGLAVIWLCAAWIAGQYLWKIDLGLKQLTLLMDKTLFVFGKTEVTPTAFFKLFTVIILIILATRLIHAFLKRQVFHFFEWDEGVRHAVSALVKYTVLFIGLSFGLEYIGLGLQTFAVLLGIIGIGIGFGLQKLATNFISGFIILFERPIKKGDFVTVGELEGLVSDISVRVTKIRTRDNISVIIPNSDFISERVVNWSHEDKRIRLHAEIGVAYGSDVELVEKILLEVAGNHKHIMKNPKPMIWFTGFGDSSLNFELLFWTSRIRERFTIVSDINKEVDRRFREEKVTIPFPQRDLHIKSDERKLAGSKDEKPVGKSEMENEPSL